MEKKKSDVAAYVRCTSQVPRAAGSGSALFVDLRSPDPERRGTGIANEIDLLPSFHLFVILFFILFFFFPHPFN